MVIKMAQYMVECRGNVRELYAVEADSEAEAMERWADGHCFLQESSSVEPVSARLEDE